MLVSKERDLSTFLLRMAVAGLITGFIIGVLILVNLNSMIDIMNTIITRSVGTYQNETVVQEYTDLIKTTLKLSPLLQPLNSAITMAIIGLIAWELARFSKLRYQTALIIGVFLYSITILISTFYIYILSGSKQPIFIIGIPSVVVFILSILFLEKKNVLSSEPTIS